MTPKAAVLGQSGKATWKCELNPDKTCGTATGGGGDMSAPRLLMRVPGDFAIETRMRITPQLREHGGAIGLEKCQPIPTA